MNFRVMKRLGFGGAFVSMLMMSAASVSAQQRDAPSEGRIAELTRQLEAPDGSVMVVAHRGCWKEAPENSLTAIKACIDLGAEMVELDVARTKDGILVLMHDKTVDRTTNGTGVLTDLTFEELKSLRLRQGAGGPSAKLTTQTVPTFAQALEAVEGKILINVDAKADVYDDVGAALKETGMANHVLMKIAAKPDDPRLRKTGLFKSVYFMPIVRQAWGAGTLSALVGGYSDLDPVAFEVVFTDEAWFVEGIKTMQAQGARIWVNTLSPHHAAGHIDELALENPDTHWGRLVSMGGDMIQTDEPESLIDYLDGLGRR